MRLFNNLKIKSNSIKLIKCGRNKTSILPNIRKEMMTEDGS